MRTTWIGCTILMMLLGAGCVQHQSAVESNWGKAFETAKTRQILNPEAGKIGAPVEGLSGEAAEKSMTKYEKSFEKAAPQDRVVNIMFK